MSCSTPGTKWPPEMKTVWNSVLLTGRLALLLRLPSRAITGRPWLCISNPGHRHRAGASGSGPGAPPPPPSIPAEIPRASQQIGGIAEKHGSRRACPPFPHLPQSAQDPLPTQPAPQQFWVLSIPVPTDELGAALSPSVFTSCSLVLTPWHAHSSAVQTHFARSLVREKQIKFLEHIREGEGSQESHLTAQRGSKGRGASKPRPSPAASRRPRSSGPCGQPHHGTVCWPGPAAAQDCHGPHIVGSWPGQHPLTGL